ncbi:MAG: hypothetical protein IT537_12950 [Hyphomicrobiales bacterium]|nr:hypothetical protein [Hyphomicrobiales bacterium]
MSIDQEMREQLALSSASSSHSGLLTTILVGVVAFAVGAGAILAWRTISATRSPGVAAVIEPPAPTFTGQRLGRAEQAPLLRTCAKIEPGSGMTPEMFYAALTTVNTIGRIAPMVGSKELDIRGQLSEPWRMIAECVFQQNGWALCDVDNRALAVASASALVRNATQVSPSERSRTSGTQRVLDAVRMRVRNGQLIAADFGYFPPPEIKAILAETKPIANGCEKS